MITVTVENSSKGIESIRVAGHANAGAYGEDLVCAGVSSISVGMLNAIDELANEGCDMKLSEGFIQATVAHSSSTLQTLLKAWILQLETMALKYPKFVRIIQKGV